MIVNSLFKLEPDHQRRDQLNELESTRSAKFYKRDPPPAASSPPAQQQWHPLCDNPDEQGCSTSQSIWQAVAQEDAGGPSGLSSGQQSNAQAMSFTQEQAEYGGIYPADHSIWGLVSPNLLSQYQTWCEVGRLTSHETNLWEESRKRRKQLCDAALQSVLRERADQVRRASMGQGGIRPGTQEWQSLIDFGRQFGSNFPDLVGATQRMADAAQRAMAGPVAAPSAVPDLTFINRPLTAWLNQNCQWAPCCRPSGLGMALRCIGRCGLDTEDNPGHPNAYAQSSRIAAATLWGLAGTALIVFAILGGDFLSKSPTPPHQRSANASSFTNVRIEFPRGGVPKDIRPIDLNQKPPIDVLSTVDADWKPPPGWDQDYDNGHPAPPIDQPPPTRQVGSKTQGKNLGERDDLEDLSCIPDSGNDLSKLIYNVWSTQFIPAVAAGQGDSIQFSAFHEEFGGPDQLHDGGQFVVTMWQTELPDWTRLKDPNIGTLDSYDFPGEDKDLRANFDQEPVVGQECFTDSRPVGSYNNNKAGWPRTDWHYSVADACYQSWGKSGEAPSPAKGFTYQGRGKNWETDGSTDGLGWGLRYKPLGCTNTKQPMKCTDFVGLHYDAQDHGAKAGGDLNNLYKTCTKPKINPDGLFRGGRIYHVAQNSGTSSDELKRDVFDPDHPNDPAINGRCGVTEIWPLWDEIEITTNPDGTDKVISFPPIGDQSPSNNLTWKRELDLE
ncbi:MAG: hypothetical protein Q9227_004678 [Pyrenula ochraceoflavens]